MIKGMLDISIPNAVKIFSTNEKAQTFLNNTYDIYEKVDGIKINIYRKNTPYSKCDVFSNFVISYKKTVLYPEDFPFDDKEMMSIAKKESIGDAQFAFIFKTLYKNRNHMDLLPRGTEFFLEFVVKKPTLSREYKKLHSLILLGYAKSAAIERLGYVTSFPEEMRTEQRKEYAALMGCDTPAILFSNFKPEYDHGYKSSLHAMLDFREYLLGINSVYGGKIEGVVLQSRDGVYKFVQDDQYDKDHRENIKMKYLMESTHENDYFLKMKALAERYMKMLKIFQNSSIPRNILHTFSILAYKRRIDLPVHSKKTEFQRREDFYHVLKYLFIRMHSENDNTLFIGRLQPPTKMHMMIIEDSLLKSKGVCVAIVKGKKSENEHNPFPFELQKRMIEKVFPEGVEVIEVNTGNLITAMNSSTLVISKFICGTDRLETYRKQLINNPELRVEEINRVNSVSGTLVRKSLLDNDIETFKANMHPKTYDFFNELKLYIK